MFKTAMLERASQQVKSKESSRPNVIDLHSEDDGIKSVLSVHETSYTRSADIYLKMHVSHIIVQIKSFII